MIYVHHDMQKLDHGKDEGKVCKVCLSATIDCVYLGYPVAMLVPADLCDNEFKKSSSCCPFCNMCVISTPSLYICLDEFVQLQKDVSDI